MFWNRHKRTKTAVLILVLSFSDTFLISFSSNGVAVSIIWLVVVPWLEVLVSVALSDVTETTVDDSCSSIFGTLFGPSLSRYHTGGHELSVPLISAGNSIGFHSDGGARLLIAGLK